MRKIFLTVLIALLVSYNYANDSDSLQVDSLLLENNEIEASLNYKTGVIELESGNTTLTVPKGFRYLDKEQSIYVLTDLWGNPPDSSILGMLVPDNMGVLDDESWVFILSFEEMGYVDDEDADDINYDDLLEEQQKEVKDANPERIKQGYSPIEFIGWASTPHYDKDKKILHWAKELKFGEDSLHTLNYNLRLLGRKGVFVMNAIATMRELPDVNSNIDNVIGCVTFKDGHKYSDFIPDVDEVAALTVGGLVAGKVLTKVGFFAVLAKFWKVILIALSGAGGGIWKYFQNKSKNA